MEDCFQSGRAALIVSVGPAYLAYLAYPASMVASCQVYQASPVGIVAACPGTYCLWALRQGLAKSFPFLALLDFYRSVTRVELMV